MIGTFRFNSSTDISPNDAATRLRKRKYRSVADPIHLGVDTGFFTNARGRWPIEAYADLGGQPSITLTQREADLIALANPGKRPPHALEALHPWLPQQYYTNNSDRNFQNLQLAMQRFGDYFVASDIFCDQKWNKVCNSVRMATDLDARFYTAWHLPVQDSYILEETRPDRHIIAIDFNAMYPSCMQQKFPKPSQMRLVSYRREVLPNETLPFGLFRCNLLRPSSGFIRKYNPLRAFFFGRYLRASLTGGVTVDLHDFEISFYQRHFEHIYIFDAIVSDESISHPLAADARRSFSRRMHYLANNNKALANREKFLSTLLTSCTHRPRRSRRGFSTGDLAEEFLKENFGIVTSVDDLESPAGRWLQGRKGLTVSRSIEGTLCDVPDLKDRSACFVFNQRIVARSRIVMLEMMQKVLDLAPDVEICYSNIDSLHFSIPSDCLKPVLGKLRLEASDHMGGYKIEAVSRGGLWLEPGRYWLYSGDVVKFRNRSIGSNGDPFEDHAIHVTSRKIGDLHIPIRMSIGMDRSMSDTRTIVDDPHAGLERQQLIEISADSSFSDILRSLERNRMQGTPRRMSAFKRLAALRENCRDLLPQDPTA